MTALLTDESIIVACRNHAQAATRLMGDTEERQEHLEYAERDFEEGARFAQGIYEARLAEDAKVRAQLVEALQDLLAYAESQICSHEETHRGGAIWEICDICGDCWADDDGGKPPRQDPEEIVATRSALLAAAKVLE